MDLLNANTSLSDLLHSANGCQYTDIDDNAIGALSNCKNRLNVLHLNIRSFQRNKDFLLMMLNDLKEKGIVIHVIGLCETFLSRNSCDLAFLENYQSLHNYREDRSGGGTSLLIHNSVRICQRIPSPFVDGFESTSAVIEYRGISAFVSEFYHPPNSDLGIFTEQVEMLMTLTKKHKLSYICCDQNFDLIKASQHKPTRNLVSLMMSYDHVPYIHKPMWVTYNSCTLIDNIYIKSDLSADNSSFVIVDNMSDHYPYLLSYDLSKSSDGPVTHIKKRKLTEEAMLKIQQDLLFHDWSPVYMLSVDNSYKYLIDTITLVMDRYAPEKVVRITVDKKFREGWFSVTLKRLNQKCRKLCRIAQQSGQPDDFVKYQNYRKILKN